MEKETPQNCLLGLRIAVLPDEEVGKASRFPQRKNNALNRSSLVEGMSNFAMRLPSNRLFQKSDQRVIRKIEAFNIDSS